MLAVRLFETCCQELLRAKQDCNEEGEVVDLMRDESRREDAVQLNEVRKVTVLLR